MPKALRFHSLGGPEVLRFEDIPSRQPADGEVLIAVEAVGLNRADSMYYHGKYFEAPSLPSGVGYEAVGRVTAVGPGGDRSMIGVRVGTIPGYSMNRYPVLAEEAVVPADVLAPIPENYSAEDGAAVWMQYATAYGALVASGRVGPGDAVLITAASSSVGLAAIQVVRAQGGVSIATTRTKAKKAELLALGADHVIVTEEEDLVARVHEITAGQGARVAFDAVGGDMMNAVGAATGTGGVIFFFGMLAGGTTAFPLTTVGRRIAVYGYAFFEMKGTTAWEDMKGYVLARLTDGTFQPKIARVFAFDKAVEAYRFLESNQQVGKVVVKI